MYDFEQYSKTIKNLPFGKRVGHNVYVLLDDLQDVNQDLFAFLQDIHKTFDDGCPYNLIKFFTNEFKLSFLYYPTFFEEAHPPLSYARTISLSTSNSKTTDYRKRDNPPILHRKESFINPERSEFTVFFNLTEQEELLGLYEHPQRIGHQKQWEELLARKGIRIVGHEIEHIEAVDNIKTNTEINRHKTAITRYSYSKPVQMLLKHGLLTPEKTFFDYGCGLGDDIRALKMNEYTARGWDPAHNPEAELVRSDVVNLGYVLNVIEDVSERAETLSKSFALANKVLSVATLISTTVTAENTRPYNDGVLTSRNTFQKYFDQDEIHLFVEETLHTSAVAVSPGIFFIFKSPRDHQQFLESRSRRQIDWNALSLHFFPSKDDRERIRKEQLYTAHRAMIESFWERIINLGRIPTAQEYDNFEDLKNTVGSPKWIYNWFIERYGKEELNAAIERRKEDLLVYLALSNFKQRVPFSNLPESLQLDIKSFFGGYRNAQSSALVELFKIGKPGVIQALCDGFNEGYLDEQALFIHTSLLDQLPPVLRMYVGVAGLMYGDMDSVDIIKIHKLSGKVTFLIYDNFFGKQLPELHLRVKIELARQKIQIFNHQSDTRQQVLYCKERYVAKNHPDRKTWGAFSKKLIDMGIEVDIGYGPSLQELMKKIYREQKI